MEHIRRVIFFFATVLSVFSVSAHAGEYKVSLIPNKIYMTLESAEAAMREAGSADLQFDHIVSEAGTERVRLYSVPDLRREHRWSDCANVPGEYDSGQAVCDARREYINWIDPLTYIDTRTGVGGECWDLVDSQHRLGYPGLWVICPSGYAPRDFVSSRSVCPGGARPVRGPDTVCSNPLTATITEPVTLKVSLTFSNQIEPTYRGVSRNTIDVLVTDQNNVAEPEVSVTITVDVESYSGGHDHDDVNRPDGNLTCVGCPGGSRSITVITDPTGKATVDFIAPEVSGTHVLKASCSPACVQVGPDRFDVGIEGLVHLNEKSDFELIGDNDGHKVNHYVEPSVGEKLYDLAFLYRKKFPADYTLRYNDASLVYGGLFDVFCPKCPKDKKCDLECDWSQPHAAHWRRPHATHRRGRNIDVRANQNHADALPWVNYWEFEDLVRTLGGGPLIEGQFTVNEHYHLTFCK